MRKKAVSLQDAFTAAVALHQAGQLAEAEQAYLALCRHPQTVANACYHLGLLAGQQGRHAMAEHWFRQALDWQPLWPECLENIIVAQERQGKFAEAVATLHDYAKNLQQAGATAEAVGIYRRLLAAHPGYAPALANMSMACHQARQHAEGVDLALAAVSCHPALPPAVTDFCQSLRGFLLEKGILKALRDVPHQGIAATPATLKTALIAISMNLANLGHTQEAIKAVRLGLEIDPVDPLLYWNLSLLLLRSGNFSEGWAAYEWRLLWKDFGNPTFRFPKPVWEGGSLKGKTLLVFVEQGFGDALQFLPLIHHLPQDYGQLVLEVPEELYRLVKTAYGGKRITVIPRLADPSRVHGDTHFDEYISALSLPARLNLRVSDLPVAVNPLRTSASLKASWKKMFGAKTRPLRVGLVWAGRPTHSFDDERSFSIGELKELFQVPDVEWISLQHHDAGKLVDLTGTPLRHPPQPFRDFADTAACISQLDLVVTVDTAVAHLAAALHKPTWIMLPFVADFRWLEHRTDSPWYPTVRLFRQPALKSRDKVVRDVAEALREMVEKGTLLSG